MQMVSVVAAAFTLCLYGPAFAEIKCGNQPEIRADNRTESFKADAAGKAQLLSKFLPSAEINGKVEQWTTEQRQQYQNLDQQELRLYTMWVSCQIITTSREMNDAEKNRQWLQVIAAFNQLPPNPPPLGTSPRSRREEVFKSFDVSSGGNSVRREQICVSAIQGAVIISAKLVAEVRATSTSHEGWGDRQLPASERQACWEVWCSTYPEEQCTFRGRVVTTQLIE